MSELQELARNAVRALPPGADIDDLLEEIIHQAKIEEGLRDSREGRTHTIEEVEKHFALKR